jgi:uncharacterized protein YqgC (DUF456 family)
MEWITYVVATLFCLLGAVCVLSIVLSLPGTWIMIGLALVIELCDSLYLPPDHNQTFGWWVILTCVGLALFGEVIELAASAAGAKGGGGSKRGMWGALIGGIVGALIFTPFIPVPIVGTLIGAILGTFIGAVVGEVTGEQAKSVRGSMKPALGATIGRVIGTFSKIGIAIVVWLVLSVAAFVP